jgi:hypothetical protein
VKPPPKPRRREPAINRALKTLGLPPLIVYRKLNTALKILADGVVGLPLIEENGDGGQHRKLTRTQAWLYVWGSSLLYGLGFVAVFLNAAMKSPY